MVGFGMLVGRDRSFKGASMKIIYLDFEYNRTTEKHVNVVCCAYHRIGGEIEETDRVWLDEDSAAKAMFSNQIEAWNRGGYTFCSYAVQAEARALLSLGIDPRKMKWVDLFLEYRMLLNNNHDEGCGKHLISGKVRTIRPPIPKYMRTEEDQKRGAGGAVEFGLVSACYKMLNINLDSKHKTEMRDLIISCKPFTAEEKLAILSYCEEDVVHLKALHKKLYQAIYRRLDRNDRRKLNEEIYFRGEFAARSALMESLGYPIDVDGTKAFSVAASSILYELQAEIQRDFPDINPFLPNKTATKFVQKQKNIRKWVAEQGHTDWMLTDKSDLSLSLDAFARHYSSKGNPNNFGNRIVRYLRTKQSLNGFLPSGKGRTFWDYVGSDGRVRPYMGIYRAQTGRSQPASTGFIPLKSSWMRALIVPDTGRAIVSIDYSQQEFLIAALLSQDRNMIAAYESGDVYLYTGKLAGAIPKDGTKAEYPAMRDAFKSTVLGIQYLMGPQGLANKLSQDTGNPHTVEQAEDLIEKFEDAYPDFQEWRQEIWSEYKTQKYLKLPCGWVMWGDNHNRRSVSNFPIQGHGSSIMRYAVRNAQNSGLEVIYTLHDALYVECDSDEVASTVATLAVAMDEAFRYSFHGRPGKVISCRMDPGAWSSDFDDETKLDTVLGPVLLKTLHLDARSEDEYRKFKKYLIPDDELALLLSI